MADNRVRYKRGAQAKYDATTKDSNTLYYCTDSSRFFLGSTEFSHPVLVSSTVPTTSTVAPVGTLLIYNSGSGNLGLYVKGSTAWELKGEIGRNTNLLNDVGKNSVKQAQDPSYTGIKIKTKNPRAYAIDNTLTDNETIGSLGDFSASFGGYAQAKGKRSFATGAGTIAKGANSFTSGSDSVALGSASHAEGYATTAEGPYSHAEGVNAIAKGLVSHAEGSDTIASGESSHTEGSCTTASGAHSHAEGGNSTASTEESHAEGTETTAGSKAFIVQSYTAATAAYDSYPTFTLDGVKGLAVDDVYSLSASGWRNAEEIGKIIGISGNTVKVTEVPSDTGTVDFTQITCYFRIIAKPTVGSTAFGKASHSEGYQTYSEALGSHSEGANTTAAGKYSHAEGKGTFAGYASHAEGKNTKAVTEGSHAEGLGTGATGYGSHAEGSGSEAKALGSHAEGRQTKAIIDYSHSEGYLTQASGKASHAEGYGTLSGNTAGLTTTTDSATDNGLYTHAEGNGSVASGHAAHAEGRDTQATGFCDHAEGQGTVASGSRSHAEGWNTKALGKRSHVEGYNNTVNGDNSHAEGYNNTVSGESSHAEGQNNTVSGNYSHAGGSGTVVSGYHSIAHGDHLKTGSAYQAIFGRYNTISSTALFQIGNGGSDNSRSNAFEVYNDGHAEVQTQGTTDNSVVNKKYINDNILDYISLSYAAGPSGNQKTTSITADNSSIITLLNKDGIGIGISKGALTYVGPSNATLIGFNIDNSPIASEKYVNDSIATQVSSVYKAKGSITNLTALSTPDKAHEGFVYNIESAFTTTADFVEGAGQVYPAGTNVVCINTTGTTYKWDVLAGLVDLSGYVTTEDLANGLSGKQEMITTSTNLVAGTVTAEAGKYLLTLNNNSVDFTDRLISLEKPSVSIIMSGHKSGGSTTPADVQFLSYPQLTTSLQNPYVTLSGIANPTSDNQAANKKYVDDAIAAAGGGGTSITVDTALSETSTNPVQNSAIYSKLQQKQDYLGLKLDGKSISAITPPMSLSGFYEMKAQSGIFSQNVDAPTAITPRIWSDSTGTLKVTLDSTNNAVKFESKATDKLTTLQNIATPTADNDAANKKYVDTQVATKQAKFADYTSIRPSEEAPASASTNILVLNEGTEFYLRDRATNPLVEFKINSAGALEGTTNYFSLTSKGAFNLKSNIFALSNDKGTPFQVVVDDSKIVYYGLSGGDDNGSLYLTNTSRTGQQGATLQGNVSSDSRTTALVVNESNTKLLSWKQGTTTNNAPLLGVATPVATADTSKGITADDLDYQAVNKAYADTKLAARTSNYDITWDSTNEAIKITFHE